MVRVAHLVHCENNGLDDLRGYTGKPKTAIARLQSNQFSGEAPPTAGRPVLRRGSRGDAVVAMQCQLQYLGFMVAVDADFGVDTEVAVAAFQSSRQLHDEGILDRDTWSALDAAVKGLE